MTINHRLKSILTSSWFIASVLLGLFFITTSYKYGWDDQHLEIPLLKHLIDPTLYEGDYYVESLQANFSSFFYPILAKLITVDQIPSIYLILYIISRYFLLFFSFKIWRHITDSSYAAFMCVASFILLIRVDEFLYRTFSHQEFALAIIFAGIYYFFKERFILAAAILGIAANFHALYSLFPMMFIGLYLLWQVKKYSLKTLITSSLTFLICALPFIIWTFQNRYSHAPTATIDPTFAEWTRLYNLACPQNFFLPIEAPFKALLQKFSILFQLTKSYWLLIALFLFNIFYNETFRKNKKAITFCVGAFGLLIFCFLFTYIYPKRFFLDLNIIRNTQFLLYFLVGFTTVCFIDTAKKHHILIGAIFGALLSLFKYDITIALLAIAVAALILLILKLKNKRGLAVILGVTALPLIYLIFTQFQAIPYRPYVLYYLYAIFILILINVILCHFFKKHSWLKQLFIIIPLCVFCVQFYYYRQKQTHIEKHGNSYFWNLQKHWEDMQDYVKDNTPKDAIIFVPHNMEMGGFRIGSERELVVSYRDCGIIGFDYNAAKEWDQRIKDVNEFNIRPNKNPERAIKNAIVKYKADYIVFLKAVSPSKPIARLSKVYENKRFVLFKIHR